MERLASADFKYVGRPSPHLSCPICLSPFLEPVTSSTCLHTFCNSCITEALVHSQQCPVDRSPLEFDLLQPANPIIRSLVNDLVVECPHHNVGCPRVDIRRDALTLHLEDECMHTPTKCPLPGCDVSLPLAEMFHHQDMHRIELDVEALRPSSSEAPNEEIVSPTASVDSRSETLSLLNRGWSFITARSRHRSHPTRRERRSFVLPPVPQTAESSPEAIERALTPRLTTNSPPPEFPFLVRALHGYDSNDLEELCFSAGDILRVVGGRDDGWWEGDHSDVNPEISFGGPYLIPKTFVEVYSGSPSAVLDEQLSTSRWNQSSSGPSVLPTPRGSIYSMGSMYTDVPTSPEFTPGRLSPIDDAFDPLRRNEVLYYVQASANHIASQEDDFDFQEGDVMAVTASSGEMRGYLLDDARRQDQYGRDRIPVNQVIVLF